MTRDEILCEHSRLKLSHAGDVIAADRAFDEYIAAKGGKFFMPHCASQAASLNKWLSNAMANGESVLLMPDPDFEDGWIAIPSK